MTLRDDALHFGVDDARRLLAEALWPAVAIETREVRVLARRQLHETEAIAHPPTRHHAARERRRLLDVVLRARRLRAVDDLLGRTPAEHADDARAEVRLGVVVPVAVG